MLNFTLKALKFSKQIIRRYNVQKAGGFGNLKITICGAAGKTGQAVALLLKSCPLVDELALYDICSTGGIAMELNHIDTKCKVYSYKRDVKAALTNAQIVAILANAPSVTGQQTLFLQNAEIVNEIITYCAQYCPKALFAIATTPINSMVPLASEVLKSYGVYNKNHIFGITTLDIMRINAVVAQKIGAEPEKVHVPVIGGATKGAAVPVLSQIIPKTIFTDDELLEITNAIQCSIQEMNQDSTFLSGAVAISQFVISLVRAIKGEQNVVENSYVKSQAYPNIEYLSTPIVLGPDGIQKILGVPEMNDYEKCMFQTSREIIQEDIRQGEDYVKSKNSQLCS